MTEKHGDIHCIEFFDTVARNNNFGFSIIYLDMKQNMSQNINIKNIYYFNTKRYCYVFCKVQG